VRIAIFDYRVAAHNPVGGCHLRLLRELAGEHQFTVFAVEFENPAPDAIEWVRVPAPTRPLALLFVVYHLLAPVCYLLYRWRRRVEFDRVQMVESKLSFGDIAYVHFCHRAYLKHHWRQSKGTGLRSWLRWLDYRLHALLEPVVYRRVSRIVTPSEGLAAELKGQYPFTSGRIQVIRNPVDIERLRLPAGFDRDAVRRGWGVAPSDVVLLFMALGHFERKGLPVLMDAVARVADPRVRLVVAGGERDLISVYRARCARLGIAERTFFAGMQRDVRPYLWGADAFALPSAYETFSLVAYEAAAAGLPLLAGRLHGVEDILRDGENGFLVERNPAQWAAAIRKLLALSPEQRSAMGGQARRSVQTFGPEHFIESWRDFYRNECSLQRAQFAA
jgi:glycosyltransferase involved in cell wall biosynthesis